MYMEGEMQMVIRRVVRNVHGGKRAEKLYINNKIHGVKSSGFWIEKKKERKSLDRAAGHAPFRPFGGVNDDLAKPLSTFII